MSSTSRGYERHKTDYYVTPQSDIREFLDKFIEVEGLHPTTMSDMVVLDPCAGGDEFNPPSYVEVLKEKFNTVQSIDIRDDSHADHKGDYLRGGFDIVQPHIIISNPPFLHAQEFVERSLELVKDGGYVIMLLRLNFFGSRKRKPFFDKHMPSECYIHHRRMSFIPQDRLDESGKLIAKSGQTDSIEYAHFVWRKKHISDYTATYLI